MPSEPRGAENATKALGDRQVGSGSFSPGVQLLGGSRTGVGLGGDRKGEETAGETGGQVLPTSHPSQATESELMSKKSSVEIRGHSWRSHSR